MAKKLHVCDTMRKSRVDIDIEKINDKWFWIFWAHTKSQAHEIRYCPYCGEKLN